MELSIILFGIALLMLLWFIIASYFNKVITKEFEEQEKANKLFNSGD